MEVRVEAPNVSEERLKEFQSLVESLLSQGSEVHAISAYIARKYLCGVSTRYSNGAAVLTLHTLQI